MKTKIVLIRTGLLIWLTGCSPTPFFPTNGSQILKSENEFGVLKAEPEVYQGQAIKLAGRIVSIEPSAQGTLVLAEWLPYPDVEYVGPEDTGWISIGRVAVFYPDKIDAEGSLHGNKFLAIGKMVGITDTLKKLPHITARCLYVWQTGSADIGEPDDEYFVMEEMYCTEN